MQPYPVARAPALPSSRVVANGAHEKPVPPLPPRVKSLLATQFTAASPELSPIAAATSAAAHEPDPKALLELLHKGLLIPESSVQWVCVAAGALLAADSNVLQLSSPVTVGTRRPTRTVCDA